MFTIFQKQRASNTDSIWWSN